MVRYRGEPIEFEFETAGGMGDPWKQAIYSRMLWDSTLDGDRLDLEFAGGVSDRRGTVSVRPINGRCDVFVANLELEELMSVGRSWTRSRTADLDFAVSYLLSSAVLTTDAALPVPHLPSGTRMAGGNPGCKVGSYS